VPLRLITTKGKSELGGLALEATNVLVGILGDYFGIKYPYPKLDIVAVPDFAAGAMENAGFMTFREELLLIDPTRAGANARRNQALVIAHELAHQWFGDLVTMQWWNDTWLNEGFATWMESKAVEKWQPGLGTGLDALSSYAGVMDADALASARAVRQPVTSSGEAEEAFDGITYEKGAALITMIEHWLGQATFQTGIHDYLTARSWKNATAEDLLSTLEHAANGGGNAGAGDPKRVSDMAATFLDRPGVPSVEAHLTCEPGGRWNVELRQEPWRPLGSSLATGTGGAGGAASASETQAWLVPVCVRAATREEPYCGELTSAGAPSLVAAKSSCPSWVLPNAESAGYYRFSMGAPEMTALLRGAAGKLDPASRMGIVASLWAQLRSGALPAEYVLQALKQFDGDASRHVTGQVLTALYGISDALVDDAARPGFRAYAMARLASKKKSLGWKPKPKEDDDAALFRKDLLFALADLAEDGPTLAEAEPIAQAWLKDPSSVDAEIGPIAVELASRRAGADRWDALRTAVRDARTPIDRIAALHGLAGFDDPALVAKTLDWMLTDETRMQDVRTILGGFLDRRAARKPTIAWILGHWDGLRAKVPGALAGRVMGFAGVVCTPEARDEVEAFLRPKTKEIEGSKRPLAEALEQASLCIALHAKDAPAIAKFFAKR
jgi:alanyl aminopeptidase